MERRPDFYVIGAPKCGTTSLYHVLRQHPDVFMSRRKEPHFFTDPDHLPSSYDRMGVEAYLELFSNAPSDAVAGEASVTYLYSVDAARRIHEFTPDARFVAPLRNPVDRAYSEYWNSRRAGMETLSFDAAIDAEQERGAWLHYVRKGFYARLLTPYVRAFGRVAIHICLFDDLRTDARSYYAAIFRFLGVDPSAEVDVSTVCNVGGAPRWPSAGPLHAMLRRTGRRPKALARALLPGGLVRLMRRGVYGSLINRDVPPMDPATRRRLQETYAADIQELQMLSRRDLAHWLT